LGWIFSLCLQRLKPVALFAYALSYATGTTNQPSAGRLIAKIIGLVRILNGLQSSPAALRLHLQQNAKVIGQSSRVLLLAYVRNCVPPFCGRNRKNRRIRSDYFLGSL
jgi:hypothetical protein